MHRGADRPVIHAARFEVARGLFEHPRRFSRIALLSGDDGAHEVAELLVLGHALRLAREDEVGDLGLASEQRDMAVVLGRARAALARQPLARARQRSVCRQTDEPYWRSSASAFVKCSTAVSARPAVQSVNPTVYVAHAASFGSPRRDAFRTVASAGARAPRQAPAGR